MRLGLWLFAGAALTALAVDACSAKERDLTSATGAGGEAEAGAATAGESTGATPSGGKSGAGGGGGSSGKGGTADGDAGEPALGGGGGGGSNPLECAPGTYDCNDDESDGCETTDVPELETPAILAPLRGTYTGSLHAPADAETLRPRLTYSTQTAGCGTLRYEVQLDDSCEPGALETCAFDSVEDEGSSSTDSYQPAADLPVSATAPVGAFYAWRVRACDSGQRCSDWSAPAHLHVGRALQDVNGDGYSDVLGKTDKGTEVYFGGKNFNGKADARLPALLYPARFVGDLNSDGFADVAGMISGFEPCSASGMVVEVIYGASDLAVPETQVLCRTAGSPSVLTTVTEAGDMNGDGFDDLGVAWGFGSTENSLMLFSGGPEVEGQTMAEAQTNSGDVSYALTVSDAQVISGRGNYDGDSYPDLVAAAWGTNQTPARLLVWTGAPELESSFAETIVDPDCRSVYWLSDPSDANGDGLSDWALVCSGVDATHHRFGVLRGGTPSSGALASTWTTPLNIQSATPFMDFNRDGDGEFLLGLSDDTAVIWQPGISDVDAPAHYARYTAARYVDVADHNGDGRRDIAFGSNSGGAFRAGSASSFNVVPTPLAAPSDATGNVSLGL